MDNICDLWQTTSFSCKFYIIASAVVYILVMINVNIGWLLIDSPLLTITQRQIWRPFTSIFVVGFDKLSIINLFFQFLWLRRIVKDRQGSTVYKIFQIIIINLQIHIIYNLFLIGLYGIKYGLQIFNMGDTNQQFQFTTLLELLLANSQILYYLGFLSGFGYGLFPVIIIYEFRNSILDPERPVLFCFFPFTIPSKYFPYFLILWMFLMSSQYSCFIAAFIIGIVQQVWLKRMIIKLPYHFYILVEALIPKFIKLRSDFVTIEQVSGTLKSLSLCSSRKQNQVDEQGQNHSNNRHGSENVFKGNGGVRISQNNMMGMNQNQRGEEIVEGLPVGIAVYNLNSQRNSQIEIQPRVFKQREMERSRQKQSNYQKQFEDYSENRLKISKEKKELDDLE